MHLDYSLKILYSVMVALLEIGFFVNFLVNFFERQVHILTNPERLNKIEVVLIPKNRWTLAYNDWTIISEFVNGSDLPDL